MNILFRAINLSDISEIQKICEIDVTIPAKFDSNFKVDTDSVIARVAKFKSHVTSADFAEVATDEHDLIIGFHILKQFVRFGEPAASVETLWVAPSYRRRGIASELKKRGEAWAQTLDLTHIETFVHAKNAKMLKLNQHLGYEIELFKMIKQIPKL